MKQTVFRTGNSLAVTLSHDFVESLDIKAGQEVESVKQPDKGRITYIFRKSLQLPLSEEILKVKS